MGRSDVMVRVISLRSASERRRRFCEMAETSIDWSFFEAHEDASSYLVDDLDCQRKTIRRELSKGEIGCYSSHVAVWTEFLASNASTLLVLEDDVIVDWAYVEFLLGTDLELRGINYLRLFNKIPVRQKHVTSPFLSQYYHLVRNLKEPLGTQGYILTKRAAAVFQAKCKRICRPIDGEIDRSWVTGIPSLSIFPAPICERFAPSSIGEARFSRAYDPGPIDFSRFKDVISRELYNLSFKSSLILRKRKWL